MSHPSAQNGSMDYDLRSDYPSSIEKLYEQYQRVVLDDKQEPSPQLVDIIVDRSIRQATESLKGSLFEHLSNQPGFDPIAERIREGIIDRVQSMKALEGAKRVERPLYKIDAGTGSLDQEVKGKDTSALDNWHL